MINTTDITKAYINSKHGWAVAEQFQDTFEQNESFERQNSNALKYICETVKELIMSKILSDDATEELQSYYEDVFNYLNDEGPEYDSAGYTEADRIVEGQYRVKSNIVIPDNYNSHHCDDLDCNCEI